MNTQQQWQPYNPQWLISLAKEQHPEEAWLPEALSNCTRALFDGPAYIYFIDPSNANKPNAPWQFGRNILLHSLQEGLIALDILTDQRVGGIEFYNKLAKG